MWNSFLIELHKKSVSFILVCSFGLYKEYGMGTPQNGDRRLPKISLEVCVNKTRQIVPVGLNSASNR